MAIKTVNPRYEGFIFDGENSRDYGIYVQDVKVFGAPTRDVEMVSIPGRDGEFVLDKGRFNNIQVVYTCALGTDTQTDFNSGVSDFRNWLASRKGYKRLEDEINTTEYRMAVFKDGLDVSTLNKETGTFEVTFDCKPQRFLKSGEIPRTIGGSITNTQTKSGAVVSIDSDGGDKATSLVSTIEAVQAGSGDPSPTNVRAITGWTEAKVFDTGKNLVDESTAIGFNASVTVDGGYISVTKNASSNYPAAHIDVYLRVGVTYTVSATCTQATAQAKLAIRNIAPSSVIVASASGYFTDGQRKSVTYTPTISGMYRVALFSCWGTADTSTAIFTDVQCEVGSTATTYEPYTGTTTTTVLGRTVYGGTVDVVTGVLTVTWVAARIGALAWGYNSSGNYFYTSSVNKKTGAFNIMSDIYATAKVDDVTKMGDYHIKGLAANNNVFVTDSRYTTVADFKTANDQRYIYVEVATPQTYNLTTHEVELLAGQNNVWADTGDISITYGHDPNKLVNPTLFNSHPLLEVDGYGAISINGENVVLHNEPLGRVQLGGGGSYKNSLTYHFDESQFNAGDYITVPDYRRTYQFDMVKPYGSGQITDFGQVSQMTAVDYIFTNTKYQGTLTLLTDITTFRVGTPKTEEYSITGILSYDDREETATPAIVTATTSVIYDGNDVIRFTAAVTIDEPQDVSSKSVAGNAPNFYGDSTWQPVTSTAYIDLDIGEAYVINDGAVIGINNIVDLPAELPTLKAGANTLTYDSTVTELVILPRWWKV